jgi:hypothetical protein
MVATPIAVAPFSMKDVSLLVGDPAGTQYEFRTSVSEVTFTPTTALITWKGLGLNQFTDASAPTWAVSLAFAQDWETPDSLSQYLHDNPGLSVLFTFKPKNLGAKVVTAQVILTPGAIGGPVDSVAVATVNLGVDGTPEIA